MATKLTKAQASRLLDDMIHSQIRTSKAAMASPDYTDEERAGKMDRIHRKIVALEMAKAALRRS